MRLRRNYLSGVLHDLPAGELEACGVCCAAVGYLGVQTWRLDRCTASYEAYRIEVKALGAAQEAENARKLEEREKIAHETYAALQKRLSDLGARYKRLRDNPSGGSVPSEPPAPALASACQPSGEPARSVGRNKEEVSTRLGALEEAWLTEMQKTDEELAKYEQLWRWTNSIK